MTWSGYTGYISNERGLNSLQDAIPFSGPGRIPCVFNWIAEHLRSDELTDYDEKRKGRTYCLGNTRCGIPQGAHVPKDQPTEEDARQARKQKKREAKKPH